MSSSRCGQWIPTPGPINSHRRRSARDPSASLGYHWRGTETARPSVSSTTSVWSVTPTFFAAAISVATVEIFMPCLQKRGFVLAGDHGDPIQLALTEPLIVRLSDRIEPKLGQPRVSLAVHVRRFLAIASKKKNRYGPL